VNIIEVGNLMKVGQYASTWEDQCPIVKRDDGLYWHDPDNGIDEIVELTTMLLSYDNWRILDW
jgi:hypothetical protein